MKKGLVKKLMALCLTGAMLITAAGCGDGTTEVATADGNGSGSGSAAGTETASDGTDTQVLNLRATTFGTNFDVQDMGWRWMMADCYEGLYRNVAGENGEEFILAGAQEVDISEDGLVYTFHLREDAKWSDGVAVTAHDYEYGWKRLLTPEHAYDYASFIFNVAGAQEYYEGTGSIDDVMAVALDDTTFQVTLNVADPTFEAKLVATPLYPTREDIAEAAGEQWGKDWTLSVYNGPFCLTELVEDNKMVWSKNENYWDAENVGLDTVNWYLVAEDATASIMFDNGELDSIQTSGDYTIKYAGEVEAGTISQVTTDYPGTQMICFNFAGNDPSGLMQNVNIRKAIAACINPEEMVDAVYGRYEPAYGLVAPAISFNGSSYRGQTEEPMKAERAAILGNTEEIQALFQQGLDELGISTAISDITIRLLTYGSTMENQTEREYLQQVIQQNIGCQVELNTAGDSSLYVAERDAGNYDIMTSSWYSDYNDPLDFFNIFYTGIYKSYGNYSNAAYDELIDALVGENDTQKRFEIYEQLETLLLTEDAACVPIYYSTRQVFLQNWVKEFKTSSFGASQELYRTYIEGRNR